MKMNDVNNTLSLYIHVPFCIKKCKYCDFNSYEGKIHLANEYIESLLKEVSLYKNKIQDKTIKTIFIGGGTPTILNEDLLEKLLKGISEYSNSAEEFTVEANPGTLTSDKLNIMKYYGVNRLSIGLQATRDSILKSLGRIHSYEEFLKTYELARKVGFKNINIDLMFGLPFQTAADWQKTLNDVTALKPEHISAYSLIVDENTEIYKLVINQTLSLPDEDSERKMYSYAIDQLGANGYKHYEISNFALPGFECLHNITYWTENEYIGLGAGASSFFQNIRYKNVDSIESYITKINESTIPVCEFTYTDKSSMIREAIILGLRMIDGIDVEYFKKRYDFDIILSFGDVISKYTALGFLEYSKGRIKLTRKGIDISNTIMSEFI